MTPAEYQKLALRTMAPQEPIRQRIYDNGILATQLENAARGMCNDTGEFSEAIKKWLEYGQPLDPVNLKEELGDVLWRIVQACDALEITLEDVMEKNIRKLAIRYGEKYSDFLAAEANRDRAAERETLAADNEALKAAAKLDIGTQNIVYTPPDEVYPLGWGLSIRQVEKGFRVYASHSSGEVRKFEVQRFSDIVPTLLNDLKKTPAEYSGMMMTIRNGRWEPAVPDEDLPVNAPVITEPSASFGDALVRETTDNSYNRLCANCRKPIHRTNQAGVCPDCYKPPVKVEDVTNHRED